MKRAERAAPPHKQPPIHIKFILSWIWLLNWLACLSCSAIRCLQRAALPFNLITIQLKKSLLSAAAAGGSLTLRHSKTKVFSFPLARSPKAINLHKFHKIFNFMAFARFFSFVHFIHTAALQLSFVSLINEWRLKWNGRSLMERKNGANHP